MSATMKPKSFVTFSLLTLIAFLMAFQKATGNVGSCNLHMYFYKTRAACEIPFFRRLQLGLATNCSNNFETLISCVKNVTRVCEDSWRSDEWIDMDVRLKFRKQFYCQKGALILPFAVCGDKYYEKGPQCVRSFHRKFRRNVTDPSLCNPSYEIKGRSKKLRPILDILENAVEKEEPRLSPAPKNLFLFHVQIKCDRITIVFDVLYVILYLIFTSEFSKAKSCIRELLNEECPTNKNSRTLHMNLLFDGYNPFCINRIYQPPTTVTTPFRIQEQNTKLPKEEERKTPRSNTLTTSSTSYNKLNLNIYFKILLVLLSADYV